MSRSSLKPALAVLAACLLAAGGAWALKSDKGQPINVHADHGEFRADPDNNNDGTGIYTGNVVITQGSIKLTAERAVLHVVNNALDTADVNGKPATFEQQPDNGGVVRGEAEEITYDASKNQILLVNDARLTQAVTQVLPSGQPGEAPETNPAERLMTADLIRYDTDTQRVVAKGGSDEQRVHISFPSKVGTTEPAPPAKRPAPAAASKTAAAATGAGTPP